jgi:hypothetical protein
MKWNLLRFVAPVISKGTSEAEKGLIAQRIKLVKM